MIKKVLIIAATALSLFATSLSAKQAGESEWSKHFKIYGFVRTYLALDTRECVAGTEDFFTYLPKDNAFVGDLDHNDITTFRFASLTSRVGLDVFGYEVNGWQMGAKIEADFYAGVSGSTGTAQLRLRQAFATIAHKGLQFKFGQAWHPMAADMPDVISLNAGAPFGPFNRSPEIAVDYSFKSGLSLSLAALWQMQYTSTGPTGASANYIKYGRTPEFYFGLSYKNKKGFLARAGVDLLSVKPRNFSEDGTKRVDDRLTTVSPFAYIQYVKGAFSVKAKTVYGQAGEHLNLNGGYAVSQVNPDGSWDYTPTRNSSTWVSLKYGKKLYGVLFGGYVKNLGTKDDILDTAHLYFSKNSFSNMRQMYRITPTIGYKVGKYFDFALEYEVTSVQYGKWAEGDHKALASGNLHWVTNHRVQAMVKFTF